MLAARTSSGERLLYLAPTGDDAQTCQTPEAPCRSLAGAIEKASPGDVIMMAIGSYAGDREQVALVDRDLTLSGGWDGAFEAQTGYSTIDGGGERRGLVIAPRVSAAAERLILRNGRAVSGANVRNLGQLELRRSFVVDGFAAECGGGVENRGTLTLAETTVGANTSSEDGGGICNRGRLTVTASAILTNAALRGGGVRNARGARLQLDNSTLSLNEAAQGAAVYSSGRLDANSVTLASNVATESGGGFFRTAGAARLRNTIVAENTAPASPNCFGELESLGYNFIGDASGCVFTSASGDFVGGSASLGSPVGSPAFHPLLFDSPAIDAGNPDGCLGADGLLEGDQRGAPRRGRCDIGAYEFLPAGPPSRVEPYRGAPQSAEPGAAFAEPLTAVVFDEANTPVEGATVTFEAPSGGPSGVFADSGAPVSAAVTDTSGLATGASFEANDQSGAFLVSGVVAGVEASAEFSLLNVDPDRPSSETPERDCLQPSAPCAAASLLGEALFETSLLANDREVTLEWDASTSPDVGGYNVYVGQSSGLYGTPLDAGMQTTYTVTGLTRGQKYFFAVTAYDLLQTVESAFSNEVSTPDEVYLDDIPSPIVVGGSVSITGAGFSAGSVIKLFVATSSGALDLGPFTPASWSPTSLTWNVPPSVPLGNGFGTVLVVNTDQSYIQSNTVSQLLYGDATDNIPTILKVGGVNLAPVDPTIPVAHVDTIVSPGATLNLNGTGFNNPLVNLFTAAGNLGPITPTSSTSTLVTIVVPVGAPTGPAVFQVVNAPYTGNVLSNAVSTVMGAALTISSVTQVGSTITVTGTGFSTSSVINFFNDQGASVVNLGGLNGSSPWIPLSVVNSTQFTFTVPAGAQTGASYVHVLNPPYIPFSSSGTDPDGAFFLTVP